LIPTFDVLLATYNGEKYLKEFLDSLANQVGVDINLLVSDDGSSDDTLKILNSYKKKFKKFSIGMGPQRGPAENFFQLLGEASSDFIAFADQDDIWHPNHLRNSYERMTKDGTGPKLTFSRTLDYRASESTLSPWPPRLGKFKFRTIMTENLARGCTICFNKEASILLNQYEHNSAVMHDWWVLLVIALHGDVTYGLDPEVTYRIHENNFIGVPKRRRLQSLQSMIQGAWKPYFQLCEIFSLLDYESANSHYFELQKFLSALEGSHLTRLVKITLARKRFRTKLTDEISLRIGILFFNVT